METKKYKIEQYYQATKCNKCETGVYCIDAGEGNLLSCPAQKKFICNKCGHCETLYEQYWPGITHNVKYNEEII